jgi:hypothetical protein
LDIGNREIHAITISGTQVYAGGERFLGVWDGTSWSPVGGGPATALPTVDGYIYAIEVVGDSIYVGGSFSRIGGIAASNIARWDGTSWSAVGGGVSGGVLVLKADEGYLYAGGWFKSAGGRPAHNIARSDGQDWEALTDGTNGTVKTLDIRDGQVYVGGGFTEAGGTAARRVARWDGDRWHPLGSPDSAAGLGIGPDWAYVSGLSFMGSDLYVGGVFLQAGSNLSRNFAIWHTQSGSR